jgi:hypothetical protein
MRRLRSAPISSLKITEHENRLQHSILALDVDEDKAKNYESQEEN